MGTQEYEHRPATSAERSRRYREKLRRETSAADGLLRVFEALITSDPKLLREAADRYLHPDKGTVISFAVSQGGEVYDVEYQAYEWDEGGELIRSVDVAPEGNLDHRNPFMRASIVKSFFSTKPGLIAVENPVGKALNLTAQLQEGPLTVVRVGPNPINPDLLTRFPQKRSELRGTGKKIYPV